MGALTADTWLRAPFPWYGGKRRVAREVWSYLGDDAGRYVEPFAGSLGVLFGRPHITGLEIVNDIDGHVVNVWRALKHSPDETIRWADDIRAEFDLTAKHLWLVNEGAARLRAGLQTDVEWHDVQVAGWWLYGVALWIGQGFASRGGEGPWTRAEIVDRERRPGRTPAVGNDGRGVKRQVPNLGNDGQGVHRQLPHLGDDGRGVHSRVIGDGIYQLARSLQNRLRKVVICNGDWSRVLTPTSLRASSGHTAVYLDPPYDGFEDAYGRQPVWGKVVDWCEHHTNSPYRIVLSGYDGARKPEGWREVAYTAASTASSNRTRERLWISPACIGAQSLFDEMAS
jgi:hypothetical protein